MDEARNYTLSASTGGFSIELFDFDPGSDYDELAFQIPTPSVTGDLPGRWATRSAPRE